MVVGGGPVGLFLGCELAMRGVRFVVLEQEQAPRRHSRSIGLHPPALEHFARLGLTTALLQRGVRVKRGTVFGDRELLGELEFHGVSQEFPFVLLLPQYETEQLLEAHLERLSPGALRRGARTVQVRDGREAAFVTYEAAWGTRTLRAGLVVGADGKRSLVRRNAHIDFVGGAYPDRYLMGDFLDTTAYKSAAVIHLAMAGVVESFPLPGGVRRWVVRTEAGDGADVAALCALIFERTGHFVSVSSCRMFSAFGVARHLAERFVVGRVVLVGDAAHEVSPIGGQGMNLGWLDAAELAEIVPRALKGHQPVERTLQGFAVRRRRRAYFAARQAEFNMAFGRPWRSAWWRDFVVKRLLRPPFRALLARLFTMRWL